MQSLEEYEAVAPMSYDDFVYSINFLLFTLDEKKMASYLETFQNIFHDEDLMTDYFFWCLEHGEGIESFEDEETGSMYAGLYKLLIDSMLENKTE